MQRYKEAVSTDAKFILRCIDLAQRGTGYTRTNPLVGCVITHNNQIIGEGWHAKYGEAHAEVNAIEAVLQKNLLAEATLYVNLEPCVHHGKTPPCADLIIKHKIQRVVVGCIDPNPLVSGKGIEIMRKAGIEVVTGVEEADCKELNAVFFTYTMLKMPYIILKWAQTADGFMAREDGKRETISNSISQEHTHRLRAATMAIMVGYNTVLHDNPQLNVRYALGENPVRIILDKVLELPHSLLVFTDMAQATWVMNTIKEGDEGHIKYILCTHDHYWEDVFKHLYNNGIASVLVEGGANILNELIRLNLWHEAWMFTSDNVWGKGKLAPVLHCAPTVEHPLYDNHLVVYKNPCYTL